MKNIILLISLVIFINILLINVVVISQSNDFEIAEGSETEICGRIITVDGFWINDYDVVVDLSVYSDRLWKPITGGYRKGDTIDISKDCRYYVISVLKHGINSKGIVKFSASPDMLNMHSHPDEFIMNLKEKYRFGEEEWLVGNINKDSAMIDITNENQTKRINYLKMNDVVWFGEYAFSVTDLDEINKKIELKKVRDYSYINFPVTPGDMINKPIEDPASGEELIIRKMKLYPKMRVDEDEFNKTPVKYWVLKIYYYHRGIASPVIKINRNGKDRMVEFNGYKSFNTEEEVLEFARVNNITDIIIDEK